MSNNYRVKVTIEEEGVKRYVYVENDSFIIGRSPQVDVPIASDLISRQQLQVSVEDGAVWIEDLGSSNGTWLNKKRLPAKERVKFDKSHVLSLGSKTGPFIFLEANEQTVIARIPNLSDKTGTFEVEEAMVSKKVANGPDISAYVQHSNPVKERLALVSPAVKSRVEQKKVEAEKNVLNQIMNLMNIESEEIHSEAVREAEKIKQKAESEAHHIIQKARENAQQALLEIQKTVDKKKAELSKSEAEATAHLEQIKANHESLLHKVGDLRASEEMARTNLENFQTEIKNERFQIEQARQLLIQEKNTLFEIKTKLETEFHDLQLEERKLKAQMEVDLLEAKANVMQVYVSAEKVQAQKDTLLPEVELLQEQKNQLSEDINQYYSERRQLENDLSTLSREMESKSNAIEMLRKDQEAIHLDIKHSREGLKQFEVELNKRSTEIESLYEDTQRVSNETLTRAQSDANKILEEANFNSSEMIRQAEADLEKIISKQEKHKAEFERVKEEMSRRISAAQDEVASTVVKGRQEADAIIQNAQNEAATIKSRAESFFSDKQNESRSLVDSAVKESVVIKDKANKYYDEKKKESDHMIQQLKVEIMNRQKESALSFAALEEKKQAIEKETAELTNNFQKRCAELDAQAASMLDEARKAAQKLKSELEAAANKEMNQRKLECEELKNETDAKRAELAEKLELEYKETKHQQQTSLAEFRQIEMASIKELRKKAEEEIRKTRQDKAKEVASSLYAMITSELLKARNSVINEAFVETASKELKTMVIDIMLDRPAAGSSKLQELLKVSDSARGKERLYWKKLGIIAGSVILLVIILSVFPRIITGPRDAIISAFTEKEGPTQADAYVQKKVEEAKERMNFNPPTTPEFKASYVKNVLYTTDFESMRSAQAFQDKWILELNDYFIHKLDVKDTTIIKFVSLESTLLKDLAKLKKQIDPQNSGPKIDEMRARESEFKEKLGVVFNDHGKVADYYRYSEKFWNDFHYPKKPSR